MCLSADWSRGGDCALAAVCAEGPTARAEQGEAWWHWGHGFT